MTKGLPEVIPVDNGPEFISKALDLWAFDNNVKLRFIQPGKPTQNAFIENFNGKFRDECLTTTSLSICTAPRKSLKPGDWIKTGKGRTVR